MEFEIVSEIDDWIQFLQQSGSEGSMGSLRPFLFYKPGVGISRMKAYLLKRILILALTLILVSGVIFVVLMLIPGDPAQIILGIHATPETLKQLQAQL